jgi:kynurenine formamidase
MVRFSIYILVAAGLLLNGCNQAPPSRDTEEIQVPRIVDLTYPFDENTPYWSAAEKFVHTPVSVGKTEGGYWYSSYNFAANEHGGTHMDAPIHFAEGGQSVDQIPIERHIGPGVKISIVEKATANPDYLLTAADIRDWEARHGPTPAGAIVLVQTGWSRFWGDRLKYFGSAATDDTAERHFPGIGRDAAEFLTQERQISMVGLDTASLDHGPSKDFIAHQILNGAGIAGLENVANLDQLPETGFLILALPMKIAGGSGGPTRIVALFQP